MKIPFGEPRRTCRLVTFGVLTALLAPCALANAGTPLMMLTGLHLLFGNAVIGVAEGILLWLIFRKSARYAIPLMIVANYLSAFVGILLLGLANASVVTERLLPGDPTQALADLPEILRTAAWIAYPIAYVVTVLLEWPFVVFALKPGKRRALKAFGASAILQSVSYAVLAPLYLGAATVTMHEEVAVSADVVPGTRDNAWIYFLHEASNLRRIRINGQQSEVIPVTSTHLDELNSLWVARSSSAGALDLVVKSTEGGTVTLIPNVCSPGQFPWELDPRTFGVDLPTTDTRWTVSNQLGFALRLRSQEAEDSMFLAFDTPLLRWRTIDAWLLPDDRVVYQLGPWIVQLDPDTRTMGVIAEGRSPVVVLDAPVEPGPTE